MEAEADIRRLRWQCRRGLLELDLLLGGFLERRYPALAPEEQEAFRCLLREPDSRVLAWFQGQESPPDELKHIIAIMSQ